MKGKGKAERKKRACRNPGRCSHYTEDTGGCCKDGSSGIERKKEYAKIGRNDEEKEKEGKKYKERT